MPPDVRQEIVRRERETTKVLGETAQARQLAGQFMQAVQPYQARLQSAGAHPIAAVQELLKADYILSSAPQNQRAAFMAKLISDYGIDVRELDTALAVPFNQLIQSLHKSSNCSVKDWPPLISFWRNNNNVSASKSN